MKWSWGWKGAVAAPVVWGLYVFVLLGLSWCFEHQYAPMHHLPGGSRAVWEVHWRAAEPGKILVNSVWQRLGHRVYPHISRRLARGPAGWWSLFPRLRFVSPMEAAGGGTLIWQSRQVAPEPLPFLVHLLLLPGMVVAPAGFLAGVAAGLSSAGVARMLRGGERKGGH